MAGIAVGSGHQANRNSAPVHVGAAPEATIVYVRLQLLWGALDTDATFEDTLMDGINFCLEAANFRNMPIVISVSQGCSWGPHNGSSLFDQDRDNLLNSFEDRAIVWPAGNDNNDQGFRRGTINSGNSIGNFTLTARRWM